MTIKEAILHLEDMKFLKGYDNTTSNGTPISEIIDEIIGILKEHEHSNAAKGCFGHQQTYDYIPSITSRYGNAHLMTFDEARENAMLYMNPDSIRPVFVEYRKKYNAEEEIRPPWQAGFIQRAMIISQRNRYGVDFRFWTDRPTEEQMESESWEERPAQT